MEDYFKEMLPLFNKTKVTYGGDLFTTTTNTRMRNYLALLNVQVPNNKNSISSLPSYCIINEQ